jgi:serine/threonine protein kinase
LRILQSVHEAGVCHGDLRYENLVINASGEVAIIDFDRAIIDAEEPDKKAEYRMLYCLLDRRVDDSSPNEATAGTIRGSRARRGRSAAQGAVIGRVTRSVGTAKETLGGMRLRPRRQFLISGKYVSLVVIRYKTVSPHYSRTNSKMSLTFISLRVRCVYILKCMSPIYFCHSRENSTTSQLSR